MKPKKSQDGRLEYKGALTVDTYKSVGGHSHTVVRILREALQWTDEYCRKMTERSKEYDGTDAVDYAQYLSTFHGYPAQTLHIDFLHYESELFPVPYKRYCTPEISFSWEYDLPVKILSLIDKIRKGYRFEITPDVLIWGLVQAGYVVVKRERRTIVKLNGLTYSADVYVRDNAREAEAFAEISKVADYHQVEEARRAAELSERRRKHETEEAMADDAAVAS